MSFNLISYPLSPEKSTTIHTSSEARATFLALDVTTTEIAAGYRDWELRRTGSNESLIVFKLDEEMRLGFSVLRKDDEIKALRKISRNY